jgi:hypothetical protein
MTTSVDSDRTSPRLTNDDLNPVDGTGSPDPKTENPKANTANTTEPHTGGPGDAIMHLQQRVDDLTEASTKADQELKYEQVLRGLFASNGDRHCATLGELEGWANASSDPEVKEARPHYGKGRQLPPGKYRQAQREHP